MSNLGIDLALATDAKLIAAQACEDFHGAPGINDEWEAWLTGHILRIARMSTTLHGVLEKLTLLESLHADLEGNDNYYDPRMMGTYTERLKNEMATAAPDLKDDLPKPIKAEDDVEDLYMEWAKTYDGPALYNNQVKFVKFMLRHPDMFSMVGVYDHLLRPVKIFLNSRNATN